MNLSPYVRWTKEHIDYVLQARAREGKFLDYKQALPLSKNDDIELLADVSAFANSSGGVILYGISEEKGEPVACPGVAPGDFDKAILRLEAVIRSNLDPALVNFHFDIIETSNKSAVVALRIPASANAPHMIAKGSPKFYARGAAGKIPMDAYEIKSAFLSADSLAAKIAQFRNERCTVISVNDLPFPLSSTSVAVLHIVPISAFQRPTQLSTEQLEKVTQDIRPPGNIMGWGPQVCLEGVAQTASEDDHKTYSYCLTFRNGCIEAVLPCVKELPQNGQKIVQEALVLGSFHARMPSYLGIIAALQLTALIVFSLSYLNAKGATPYVRDQIATGVSRPIQREILHLPPLESNEINVAPEVVLKHFSDLLANAAGRSRSAYFTVQGRLM